MVDKGFKRTNMNRRDFLKKCAGVAGGLAMTKVVFGAKRPIFSNKSVNVQIGTRPNILIIVSDDQGYGDSSCYYHPPEVSTPCIDKLAAEGVRLTHGYASAYVCAPTRAGLLTGRYQQRFGFYEAGDSRVGLPLDELTIADLLKDEGYVTGIFGKWHVGLDYKYRPLQRGFDEFYGFLGHGAHDYFDLTMAGTDAHNWIYRNNTPIDDAGYLTVNLAKEAVSFIENHHKEPFFCYLPFNAVHWPLQALEKYSDKYDTGDSDRDIYMGMLECMDGAIGEVLKALKRTGVEDNTLVFFFSDNGGAKKNLANNGLLRDFKQSVYEGGIHVPFIVKWPGKLKPGTVCDEPIICLDIFPTIISAIGAELPDDRVYDGRDMLPALKGELTEPLHDALFWDGGGDRWAVRVGNWKLLSQDGNPAELYDLESDLSEHTDLAASNPTKAAELQARYDDWRSQMGTPI